MLKFWVSNLSSCFHNTRFIQQIYWHAYIFNFNHTYESTESLPNYQQYSSSGRRGALRFSSPRKIFHHSFNYLSRRSCHNLLCRKFSKFLVKWTYDANTCKIPSSKIYMIIKKVFAQLHQLGYHNMIIFSVLYNHCWRALGLPTFWKNNGFMVLMFLSYPHFSNI